MFTLITKTAPADLDSFAASLKLAREGVRPLDYSLASEAAETLRLAGVSPSNVNRCVMVGGSALLMAVRAALQDLCPTALIETERAMTAVADGLALAAQDAAF